MKKFLVVLAVMTTIFVSCNKEEELPEPQAKTIVTTTTVPTPTVTPPPVLAPIYGTWNCYEDRKAYIGGATGSTGTIYNGGGFTLVTYGTDLCDDNWTGSNQVGVPFTYANDTLNINGDKWEVTRLSGDTLIRKRVDLWDITGTLTHTQLYYK